MTKRFISPREASEYLALKVKTVYSLAARGLLPAVRFGRQLRIDLRRLDEQTEAEIQSNSQQKPAGGLGDGAPRRLGSRSALHSRGQNGLST